MRGSLAAMTLIVTAVATGCGASSGEGSASTQEYSARTFASVQQLARSSDLIVMGRPVAVVSRELDGGGERELDANGEPAPGAVPMTFFDFAVDRRLGSKTSPERIIVGWVDASPTFQTPLSIGSTVVLYLQFNAAGDTPGITSVGDHYVPLSGDNGTFDVRDGRAVARSAAVRSLRDGQPPAGADQRLDVPLSSLAGLAGQARRPAA